MQCKKITRVAVGIGVASLLYSPAELPAQCAMCWQTLANSAEGASLVRGFNDGILFLLVVPFLVVGIIGFRIYRVQRQPVPGDWSLELALAPPAQTFPPRQERSAGVPALR